MLLILSDEQKEHMSLLSVVGDVVATEFCRIAVDFIKNGINAKKYLTAAQKLNTEAVLIRHSVEAIMYVLSECSKLQISEADFQHSLVTVGLSEELNACLLKSFTENSEEIRSILNKMALVLPHYEKLEWRFDVKLASRMLSYQTTPQILLKLHINTGERNDTKILQTDPVNLVHITNVLEDALAEMKSAHCRRIARTVKWN